MKYSKLLQWAEKPHWERNDSYIDVWVSQLKSRNEELNELAVFLAKGFCHRELSYETASTLFNQIMPVVGFDSAPSIFWGFYVAFEDYEISTDPNREAVSRIETELKNINAI
jgi:hypothetical protein